MSTQSKIVFTERPSEYECSFCKTTIPSNTNGKLIYCKCRKVAVEGTLSRSRIVGDWSFLKKKEEIKELCFYRIRQISSGLFFQPRSFSSKRFSIPGKIYSKMPSLKWIIPSDGECVIEAVNIS